MGDLSGSPRVAPLLLLIYIYHFVFIFISLILFLVLLWRRGAGRLGLSEKYLHAQIGGPGEKLRSFR